MRRGFTLVEMLVAMATGLLVSTAALIALSSAFSAWTRLASGGTLLETQRALFRLERDLASAAPLPLAPFEGSAAHIKIPFERRGSLRVVEWSSDENLLLRSERPYAFSAEEDSATTPHPAVSSTLESFRLPSRARITYQPHADSPDLTPDLSATVATNLPYRVHITIGDIKRTVHPTLAPNPAFDSP